MVLFDQLRVSDDGQRLYINIHVNEADYFNNIYLDELVIQTADQVSETDPNTPTENYVYRYVFDGEQKTAAFVLLPSDLNENFSKSDFTSDLFFVFVKVKGVPSECTPCRLDEETTLGVTFDTNMLYQKVMDYTRELTTDCTIPQGFTDFILLWNGFKAAVDTEHFIVAIDYWKRLFEDIYVLIN